MKALSQGELFPQGVPKSAADKVEQMIMIRNNNVKRGVVCTHSPHDNAGTQAGVASHLDEPVGLIRPLNG